MAHGDAREERWSGIWRMAWVASTLHIVSEHGVTSITTADAHTSAASSRLNWRLRRFKWTRRFRRKTRYGFCACAITFETQSTTATDRILREMYLGRSKEETNRRESQGTSTSFGMLSHNCVLKLSLGLATETRQMKLWLADAKRFPVLAERLSWSQLVLVLQLAIFFLEEGGGGESKWTLMCVCLNMNRC